jgi:hypothetical protein
VVFEYFCVKLLLLLLLLLLPRFAACKLIEKYKSSRPLSLPKILSLYPNMPFLLNKFSSPSSEGEVMETGT